VFKRQRRADVVVKGLDSEHFVVAVQRMIQLLEEMEKALQQHEWLAGSSYSLADVAFTPYLARLEHLNILQMVGHRARVANWYDRCKARSSFEAAIRKWENPDYLTLMKRRGIEHWPQLQKIIQGLTAAAA
jgi:glutathione S-transferase